MLRCDLCLTPESVWSLLLVEFWVVRFGGLNLDICNKLWLNFCLKQIENNGPLINMIYKVLKNSAQGLLSSIHVRLLALKCAHPIAFSSSSQCSGFYRCLLVYSSASCKILFVLPLFFFLFSPLLESVCEIMADLGVWFHFIMFWKWMCQIVTPMWNFENVKACLIFVTFSCSLLDG